MPYTDTKPELTAKASMAQSVSQPAVYANGLNTLRKIKSRRMGPAKEVTSMTNTTNADSYKF
jgi:hypothetical protein